MPLANDRRSLDEQIAQWREHVRRRSTDPHALQRHETQLRSEISALTAAGLQDDEAFLVAVKRTSAATTETGRADQWDRAWQSLAVNVPEPRSGAMRSEAFVAWSLAVLAGVAIKVPALFGVSLERHEGFYGRNASLFVLPCLLGYFAWKRKLARAAIGWLAVALAVAGLIANLPWFGGHRDFEALTALHLPIALLLPLAIAYAGARWWEVSGRMEFIRFSGELFIYYVLIALGGGVLCAFMALTFTSIGVAIGPFLGTWLVPCGAAGAVVVASWLVESKHSRLENLAPMLTRLFTPLFAAMLVAFLGAVALSSRGIAIERNLLIGFDLLLVVVLGLLLYSVSARNPQDPPGIFDVLQVVLVISALLADGVALSAMGFRIREFGFSPNRVAALGENVILLVNLAWSAVLYSRFVLRRGSFQSLEKWQTSYLPVYAAWGAVVAVFFPPLFRSMVP